VLLCSKRTSKTRCGGSGFLIPKAPVDSITAPDDTLLAMRAVKKPVSEGGGYSLLKLLLRKIRELLSGAIEVRYVSVPVWRPWRDF
jgi:hypothetical protein